MFVPSKLCGKANLTCKATLTYNLKRKGEANLNNKLKILRETRNLSQGDLAKLLSVSRQTIISIEKERYNPSLDLAFSIASIFNCKIEDIFIPNSELEKENEYEKD